LKEGGYVAAWDIVEKIFRDRSDTIDIVEFGSLVKTPYSEPGEVAMVALGRENEDRKGSHGAVIRDRRIDSAP
jgi:hypothetical protein